MENTISRQDAVSLLKSSKGRYFTVWFTKRGDGSPRRLTGRFGVKKGVKGDGKRFDPAAHNLLTVSETVQARDAITGRMRTVGTQFRHVGIERIEQIRVGGKTFRVSGGSFAF